MEVARRKSNDIIIFICPGGVCVYERNEMEIIITKESYIIWCLSLQDVLALNYCSISIHLKHLFAAIVLTGGRCMRGRSNNVNCRQDKMAYQ